MIVMIVALTLFSGFMAAEVDAETKAEKLAEMFSPILILTEETGGKWGDIIVTKPEPLGIMGATSVDRVWFRSPVSRNPLVNDIEYTFQGAGAERGGRRPGGHGGPPPPNRAPVLSGPDSVWFAENGTATVATYPATDGLRWSLGGVDAAAFEMRGDALRFQAPSRGKWRDIKVTKPEPVGLMGATSADSINGETLLELESPRLEVAVPGAVISGSGYRYPIRGPWLGWTQARGVIRPLNSHRLLSTLTGNGRGASLSPSGSRSTVTPAAEEAMEPMDSLATKNQGARIALRVGKKVGVGVLTSVAVGSMFVVVGGLEGQGGSGIGAAFATLLVGQFFGYPLGVYLADREESSFWMTFGGQVPGWWGAVALLEGGDEGSEARELAAVGSVLGGPVLASELSRLMPRRFRSPNPIKWLFAQLRLPDEHVAFRLAPETQRGLRAVCTLHL